MAMTKGMIEGREVHLLETRSEAAWLKARAENINSTEAAALVGCSPYGTYLGLWAEKTGKIEDPFVPNQRSETGKKLEPAIAKLVAAELGAKVRKVKPYIWCPADRMGSTFDYRVDDETSEWHNWLLEIKNVDFLVYRENWIESDGTPIEGPEHIELQGQHQCEVSGAPGVIFAALVGGNDLKLIYRPRDKEQGQMLRELVRGFWDIVENGGDEVPEPTVVGDGAVMAQIYREANGPENADATDVVVQAMKEYYYCTQVIRQAKAAQDMSKAIALREIRNAKRVVTDLDDDRLLKLSATTVKAQEPEEITEDMVGQKIGGRKGYRLFKIATSKKKAPPKPKKKAKAKKEQD